MKLPVAISLLWALIFASVANAQNNGDFDYCSCPTLDLVFLIDRAYFTNVRFTTVIHPFLNDIADGIYPCSDVRVSFVEYGAYVNLQSYLDSSNSTAPNLNYTREYRIGQNLGPFALLGEGLEVVKSQVISISK